MANKIFDIYKDDKVVQAGVPSPVEIDSLAPNTQYDDYEAAYAGKSDKTPLSFKTAVQVVTGVSLDKTTLALETGATAAVKATIAPSDATDKAFTFSSADTSIATVDSNGKITAIKAGTVVITVTTHDGAKTATVTVTITDPVIAPTGVTLDSKNATTVEVGADITLAAAVAPTNATDKGLVWSSSDETIATVDQNGKVTGVKAGDVDITAKAHGDQSKGSTTTIAVTDPAPAE